MVDFNVLSHPHPVGSSIFLSFSLLFLSLLVLLLLRHYLPLRKTPAFLLLPVFLAIFLPASLVLLVPIDLASTLRNNNGNDSFSDASKTSPAVWLPYRSVLVFWRITYWLIFALTWVILPFLSEFLDSYHPSARARSIASLRANFRYHLTILTLAIAGIIYVSIAYGLRLASLKSLIMALAYIWGLALAIYLMGHGLVAVPRQMFRSASYGNHLRRLQTRAVRVWDKLIESQAAVREVEATAALVAQRKGSVHQPFLRDWIEDLGETVARSSPLSAAKRVDPEAGHPDNSHVSAFMPASTDELRARIPTVITERYLADLTRRVHRARHRQERFVSEWTRLVQDAVDTQAVIDSVAKGALEFKPRISAMVASNAAAAGGMGGSGIPSAATRRCGNWSILTPSLRYVLYVHVLPYLRLAFAVLLTLASASIVISEVFRSIFPSFSIVSLTIFPRSPSSSSAYTFSFYQQLTTSLWLLYMSACALYTLTTTTLTWRQRALVPRNTHGESAAWYAGQIARLTVPMAYNFVTLLPDEVHKNTVFYSFLGRWIVLTSLGKGLDRGFPIFVLVPVMLSFFDVYKKVGRVSGMVETEEDDDSDDPAAPDADATVATWREGQQLIEQELTGPGALGLSSGRGTSAYGYGGGSYAPGSSSTAAAAASSSDLLLPADDALYASSASSTANTSPYRSARPRSSAAQDRGNTGAGSTTYPSKASKASTPLLTRISNALPFGGGDGAGDDEEDGDGGGEEEGESGFMAFAHRVRNTVETALPWQRGEEEVGRGRIGQGQGQGNFLDRLFGGGGGGGGQRSGGGIRL